MNSIKQQDDSQIYISCIWEYVENERLYKILSFFITTNQHFYQYEINEQILSNTLRPEDMAIYYKPIDEKHNFTGIIKKYNNEIFKKNEIVHIYMIAYYDNTGKIGSCKLVLYGIFKDELNLGHLETQLINEKKYGSKCEYHKLTTKFIKNNIFNIIHLY